LFTIIGRGVEIRQSDWHLSGRERKNKRTPLSLENYVDPKLRRSAARGKKRGIPAQIPGEEDIVIVTTALGKWEKANNSSLGGLQFVGGQGKEGLHEKGERSVGEK